MQTKMKNIILIILLFSVIIKSDYSEHEMSEEVIFTLVKEHGFERDYVIEILKNAKKQQQWVTTRHFSPVRLGHFASG